MNCDTSGKWARKLFFHYYDYDLLVLTASLNFNILKFYGHMDSGTKEKNICFKFFYSLEFILLQLEYIVR
jgi:hypothetical protein